MARYQGTHRGNVNDILRFITVDRVFQACHNFEQYASKTKLVLIIAVIYMSIETRGTRLRSKH